MKPLVITILLAIPALAHADDLVPSDDGSVAAQQEDDHSPDLAVEVDGVAARAMNPYLQYMGWDFKTGTAEGARVALDVRGMRLAFERTSAANQQVCGVGCTMNGAWGSTTIETLDAGYRMRMAAGVLRPVLEMDLGVVRADSGTWSARSSTPVWGGEVRGGAGLEVHLGPNVFATATAMYRFALTENPLRDPGKQKVDSALLGVEPGAGDYAEDAHDVVILVGLGVGM